MTDTKPQIQEAHKTPSRTNHQNIQEYWNEMEGKRVNIEIREK